MVLWEVHFNNSHRISYVIFKAGSSKAELKLKNGEKLQSGVKYTQKPTYMQWLKGSKKEFTMK